MKLNDFIEDGRKSGEPHLDWSPNREYLQEVLTFPNVMLTISSRNMRVKWKGIGWRKDGTDEGTYDVYTHLELSWNENNKLYAVPINLHVSHETFKENISIKFKVKKI